ncbi:MAG TPA: PKD domain-containing protein [Thermoplasmata archaeon]|jgi:hypothetical protein
MIVLLVFSCLIVYSHDSPTTLTPEDEVGPEQLAESLAASVSNFTVSPNVVHVGEQVTFFANATSTTSSTLKFTLYYDYILTLPSTPNPASGKTVVVTGNPGQIAVPYAYDHPGNFTGALGTFFVAKLYVDDGASNVSKVLQVYVNLDVNVAPTFEFHPPSSIWVFIGEALNLSVLIRDLDNDSLIVAWEFGDGETVVQETVGALLGVYSNQTHAWTPIVAPGEGDYEVEYLLNVTADDGFGNVIGLQTMVNVYVPVNVGPAVALSVSSLFQSVGDEVLFYANATDPEGDPLTWTFYFDDGIVEVHTSGYSTPNTTQWMNVSHVYGAPGNFTVLMYVSDALIPNQIFPHNKSVSLLIRVKGNTAPSVSTTITADPNSPEINSTLGNVTVRFFVDVSDADADAVNASWYLDGVLVGSNVSQATLGVHRFYLTLVFVDTGLHNVSIYVTDGRESHDVHRYLVIFVGSNNMPPELEDLSFEYEGGDFAAPGEVIQFTSVFSDDEMDPIELTLDFGDSSEQLHMNLTDYVDGNVTFLFSHSYADVGTYTMTIWYTDNMIGWLNHSKFIEAEIRVDALLMADAGPDQGVLAGEQVFFDASGSVSHTIIENWTWTFMWHGSPVELYGKVVSFVFDEPFQSVNVTLNVTDDLGNWDTDELVVNISGWIPEFQDNLLPMALFTVALIGILLRRRAPNKH